MINCLWCSPFNSSSLACKFLAFQPSLKDKTMLFRKERLSRIATFNERRCAVQPVYGSDLCQAVMVNRGAQKRWIGALNHQRKPVTTLCWTLTGMIKNPTEILDDLSDIIER